MDISKEKLDQLINLVRSICGSQDIYFAADLYMLTDQPWMQIRSISNAAVHINPFVTNEQIYKMLEVLDVHVKEVDWDAQIHNGRV